MSGTLRPSTRDAIIDAAFERLSRDPSVSLADIAERAGVGRATLHRHFSGRDDLIRALALIAIEEMDAAAEAACEDAESSADAFQRMLTALIPLGDRHGFLAREPIEDDPQIAAAFERQTRETHEMVEEAKAEGVFDPAVPTSWITQAFDHLLFAAWESTRTGDTTPAQAADLAWRTLARGVTVKS